MIKKIIITLAVLVLGLGSPVKADEPVKVAVIPSVLNMFIQYSVLQGILEEDENLFERTFQSLQMNIGFKNGFAYSSRKLGHDDNAATDFIQAGPYPSSRDKYDADLITLIGNSDNSQHIEVFVVAVETGRAISSFIDTHKVNNNTFVELVNDSVLQLLDHWDELMEIKADRIVDPDESIVQYRLPSLTEDVLVNIDYDESHEIIENVLIYVEDFKNDGEYEFELLAEEDRMLKIKYFIRDRSIADVGFDADFRPDDADEGLADKLIVMSKEGYGIEFHLYWGEEGIVNVKVSPTTNPYRPHLLENI